MLSRSTTLTKAQRWRRGAAVGTGLALITGLAATKAGPFAADASSHREAPLIAGDPRADNTDVYAFVSPDATDSVTFIANWIPFEEPNGGPNFYTWADDTRYNIKIDNDGDALADLTYTWVFDTHYRTGDGLSSFLSNTGQVTSLDDPDLFVIQTYDLTVTPEGGPTVALLGDGDGTYDPTDPIAAPSIAGAASMPNYAPLRDQAIYTLPGGGKTYSGQADDPFFLDLRVFDLLYGANATEVGEDTLAGYNVNTIALQVPKNAVAIGGNATRNPVIGIWSTTDRRTAAVVGQTGPLTGAFTQVSRLGNPLVNEVVIPLKYKDAFNTIGPDVDASLPEVVDKVERPILPNLIQAIYGVPKPAEPRNDLVEIFLQGISRANAGLSGDPNVVLNVDLNSQTLNMDETVAFRPSEMLRLNMSVPPATNPNSYGVLAGDVAGFPNGRRLTDDVVDIAVQAVEGAAQSGQLVTGLLAVDSVDRNDRPFLTTFPYVALPHVDSVNLGPERSPRAPELISINPVRVLETRTGVASGQIGYTGARPAAAAELTVKVVGTGLAPEGTTAVYLNVTAVNSDDGFVTVYPCGTTRPNASAFNPLSTQITHNLVVSKVGTNGNVCIYTNSATDLVADLTAYHPANSEYKPVQPQRVLETRTNVPNGQVGYTGAQPADGTVITLKVTGIAPASVPADATAVMLNLTAVNGSGNGWATVYPCGTTRPNTSNVNFVAGVARANLVAAKIGTGANAGNVCIYVNKAADLVADIEGFSPSSSSFVPTVPERLLETRLAEGQVGYSGSKPRGGQTIELRVTGVGTTKVPANAGSVFLNVTATESNPGGFVTVFPCGSPRPLASNLSLTGVDTPNLVAAKIGEGGRVCIYTSNDSHFVADLAGYFPDTNLVGS